MRFFDPIFIQYIIITPPAQESSPHFPAAAVVFFKKNFRD
jgi:hypothetical protein